MAEDLNLKKPYDENFYKVMADVCSDLFKEFSPSFVYTFSDEISLLLEKIPFDGRVEKINSVMASFASSSFVMHYDVDFKKPPSFDSRVVPIGDDDIVKYFRWRQDESWKNCVASYGIHFLKSKYSNGEANDKINGLKSSDIHELLYQNGINLNDVETYKKRGIAVYRKNKKLLVLIKKRIGNRYPIGLTLMLTGKSQSLIRNFSII